MICKCFSQQGGNSVTDLIVLCSPFRLPRQISKETVIVVKRLKPCCLTNSCATRHDWMQKICSMIASNCTRWPIATQLEYICLFCPVFLWNL